MSSILEIKMCKKSKNLGRKNGDNEVVNKVQKKNKEYEWVNHKS